MNKEEIMEDKIRALDDTQIRIIEQLKELVEIVTLLSAKGDEK